MGQRRARSGILGLMILEFVAGLKRPAIYDLLGGLQGVAVFDDGSMTDADLLEHVASALRDLLGAHEGTLTQVLRERLAFVATTIGVSDLDSALDLTTDCQLAWWVADWLFNEGEAVAQGCYYENPQVAEALGRRFLSYGQGHRRRHVEDILSLNELAAERPRTDKERQPLVEAVMAGRPPVEDPDYENAGSAYLLGLWLGESLCDARVVFKDRDPKLQVVSIAAPPATDFLAAWLLSVATIERAGSGGQIRASSSRTRAQWTRVAQALSAVSLTVRAYSKEEPRALTGSASPQRGSR